MNVNYGRLAGLGALLGASGIAGLAWAIVETQRFRMRFEVLPILPPGTEPIRILHLSDLHMTPTQGAKRQWVAALARWEADLVVGTGDFLAHPAAVPVVLEALAPLRHSPGVFVLGSNDYLAPDIGNPASYLRGPSNVNHTRVPLPWPDLVSGLTSFGWQDLDNRRARLSMDGSSIDARGVDDPHINLDDYAAVAGPFDDAATLRLGVTHAPYRRVVDAMSADGADLVIAGHTHGGQLRVPMYGALVTNCDIPRHMARGLHHYTARDGDSSTWLHVSAGLGQSPYAPVRFACPPEAILLTLVGSDFDARHRLG